MGRDDRRQHEQKYLPTLNKNLTSTLLLAILGFTDAYLLANPNLVGRLGILIYKHSYLKTFPRALATVFLVLGVCLAICEIVRRVRTPRAALAWYLMFLVLGLALFAYVYVSFTSFSYGLTGKAFIYGAHLLPVLMIAIFGRYLVWSLNAARKTPEL